MARIMRRLFYNEDVGGMFCTCASPSKGRRMSYRGFTRAWRRAVEYWRAALRKATGATARKVTPQPSALGYARIPVK